MLLAGYDGVFLVPDIRAEDVRPTRLEIPPLSAIERFESGAVWVAGRCVGRSSGGTVVTQATLRDHVHALAVSRGRIVTATWLWGALRNADDARLEHVLETRSGKRIATAPLPPDRYVETGAMSPDGELFAVGDRFGATHLYRACDGAWLSTFSGTADGGSWSVSREGTNRVAGASVRRTWGASDD